MIALIVALNNNNTIGLNNNIPWHSKEDLKYFKKITDNSTVIMGRKTFESIGKPLKNRQNFVVSSQKIFNNEIKIFNNIELAIKNIKTDNAFFIGGSKIYEESIKYCDKLFITKVNNDIIGDTFFNCCYNDFNLISENKMIDLQSNLNLNFKIYERIKNG